MMVSIAAPNNVQAEVASAVQYRSGSVDTVLLQAINAVQTLGLSTDISVDRPLAEAVGAVQALGRPSQIDAAAQPISTIVGDLGATYRTPLQVDWTGDAQGIDAPPTANLAQEILGLEGTTESTPQSNNETTTETPTAETAEADVPIAQEPDRVVAASVQQQLLDALQLRSREVDALRNALRQS